MAVSPLGRLPRAGLLVGPLAVLTGGALTAGFAALSSPALRRAVLVAH
ncbi:hypothetical protein [Salinispora fenicalii]|nr:hypothetical protein [Salinispora fenicalii]